MAPQASPCFVRGRVLEVDGKPVAHALMEVWQADQDGHYDVQSPPAADGSITHRARGKLRTDAQGRYAFRSILAEPYPIPTMVRSARCCPRWAGIRGGPRICIS